MSVAERSTRPLRMPRNMVHADLQAPWMRNASPLALYCRMIGFTDPDGHT